MLHQIIILLTPLKIYAWLITALAFMVAELTTPGLFFFLAFGAGSCIGALLTWHGSPFTTQASGALISSLISVWILRKLFAQHISAKQHVRTNYEALSGQTGIVTKTIQPHQSGLVKTKGEVWPAKSETNDSIASETIVSVSRIVGNHIIVKPLLLLFACSSLGSLQGVVTDYFTKPDGEIMTDDEVIEACCNPSYHLHHPISRIERLAEADRNWANRHYNGATCYFFTTSGTRVREGEFDFQTTMEEIDAPGIADTLFLRPFDGLSNTLYRNEEVGNMVASQDAANCIPYIKAICAMRSRSAVSPTNSDDRIAKVKGKSVTLAKDCPAGTDYQVDAHLVDFSNWIALSERFKFAAAHGCITQRFQFSPLEHNYELMNPELYPRLSAEDFKKEIYAKVLHRRIKRIGITTLIALAAAYGFKKLYTAIFTRKPGAAQKLAENKTQSSHEHKCTSEELL
ncbi:NfeD family protein [Candidatus Babeliales bacterium]|nr:NfeD family protein [Candidatus Babeliales bacterium]